MAAQGPSPRAPVPSGDVSPPLRMLRSEKPQSTRVPSSHPPPKPSSAPLLLLSSPSHRANPPLLPLGWVSHTSRTHTTPSMGISAAGPGSTTQLQAVGSEDSRVGRADTAVQELAATGTQELKRAFSPATLPGLSFSSFLQSLGGQEECLIIRFEIQPSKEPSLLKKP